MVGAIYMQDKAISSTNCDSFWLVAPQSEASEVFTRISLHKSILSIIKNLKHVYSGFFVMWVIVFSHGMLVSMRECSVCSGIV